MLCSYLQELSQLLDAAGLPHSTLPGSLDKAEELREALRQAHAASTDRIGAPLSSHMWGPDDVLWIVSLSESFFAAQQAAQRHLQEASGGWSPHVARTWEAARDHAHERRKTVRYGVAPG